MSPALQVDSLPSQCAREDPDKHPSRSLWVALLWLQLSPGDLSSKALASPSHTLTLPALRVIAASWLC